MFFLICYVIFCIPVAVIKHLQKCGVILALITIEVACGSVSSWIEKTQIQYVACAVSLYAVLLAASLGLNTCGQAERSCEQVLVSVARFPPLGFFRNLRRTCMRSNANTSNIRIRLAARTPPPLDYVNRFSLRLLSL